MNILSLIIIVNDNHKNYISIIHIKLVSSIRRHSYLSVSLIFVERRFLSRGVARGGGHGGGALPDRFWGGSAPPPRILKKKLRGMAKGARERRMMRTTEFKVNRQTIKKNFLYNVYNLNISGQFYKYKKFLPIDAVRTFVACCRKL